MLFLLLVRTFIYNISVLLCRRGRWDPLRQERSPCRHADARRQESADVGLLRRLRQHPEDQAARCVLDNCYWFWDKLTIRRSVFIDVKASLVKVSGHEPGRLYPGNYIAMRYGPSSEAVKYTWGAAPKTLPYIYYVAGDWKFMWP